MPIYEYRCEECGNEVELLQHLGRGTSPQCDECGGEMKRLISPTSFILKGEGWYVTDYPSKDRKAAMEAEKKRKDKKKESGEKAKPPAPAAGKTAKKSRKTRPPRKA
jgi:putative FmdB family regulatory protein